MYREGETVGLSLSSPRLDGSVLLLIHRLLSFAHASHARILSILPARQYLGARDLALWQRGARGDGDHIVVLVHELEVVPRQQVRDRGELGTVASCIVIQLKERDRQELHVLRDGEDL